jgi:hypothetical protein
MSETFMPIQMAHAIRLAWLERPNIQSGFFTPLLDIGSQLLIFTQSSYACPPSPSLLFVLIFRNGMCRDSNLSSLAPRPGIFLGRVTYDLGFVRHTSRR